MTNVLLNPFSVQLKKHPYINVSWPPMYENGDYKIYELYKNHYLHTFKNVVIAERGKPNKELILNLISDTKPKEEASLYHDYERPKEAILNGLEAAAKLGFEIK